MFDLPKTNNKDTGRSHADDDDDADNDYDSDSGTDRACDRHSVCHSDSGSDRGGDSAGVTEIDTENDNEQQHWQEDGNMPITITMTMTSKMLMTMTMIMVMVMNMTMRKVVLNPIAAQFVGCAVSFLALWFPSCCMLLASACRLGGVSRDTASWESSESAHKRLIPSLQANKIFSQ